MVAKTMTAGMILCFLGLPVPTLQSHNDHTRLTEGVPGSI